MRKFEPSELKALFARLVDSVGTHEAAATFLGVSRQRIGQLIAPATPDLPTWAQVYQLEQVCGCSIVYYGLGRHACPKTPPDAMSVSVEATAAHASYCAALQRALADGRIDDGEHKALLALAQRGMELSQTAFDLVLARGEGQ